MTAIRTIKITTDKYTRDLFLQAKKELEKDYRCDLTKGQALHYLCVEYYLSNHKSIPELIKPDEPIGTGD